MRRRTEPPERMALKCPTSSIRKNPKLPQKGILIVWKALTSAATASTLLLAGAGTAMAETQAFEWTANSKYSSASASGDITEIQEGPWSRRTDATGKLTVTDPNPKACYSFRISGTLMGGKPGGTTWGKRSAKQCGPGTITTTSSMYGVVWDLRVDICKNTECD